MAKITVVGNAAVVQSSATLEQIKTMEKIRPNALVLLGGKEGKDEVFRIGTGAVGEGGLSECGACFDGKNAEGYATITIAPFAPCGDVKQAIYEQYGAAIALLNKLEGTFAGVLSDIDAQKQGIMDAITLA